MSEKLASYAAENAAQTVAMTDTFSVERYLQFARHLPLGPLSLLDIGCGEGRGGMALAGARSEIKISGLDCVQERLDKLPDCYFDRILGLSNQIPIPDRIFDALVAGEFLEHLYPSDVDPTLCEFQRVLKIGGKIMMTTPNPRSLRMRARNGTVYGTAHLTQHYPEILSHRLKMHGFSKVKILGSGKAIRYFGEHFPWLSVYGSYLIMAEKI